MRMVVKIAGALLDDPESVRTLANQIAQLAQQGHELLVVHGGGKIFTATLKSMGIESHFVNGLRVTDRRTRDVAVMVMGGLLNKRVAGAVSAAGQPAVGMESTSNSWNRYGAPGLCRWLHAWASAPTANFTILTPTTWPRPARNFCTPNR
jgi:acetylglutamate kinase